MKTILRFFFFLLTALPSCVSAAEVTIVVHNDDAFQRQELVEISVDSVRRELRLRADEPFVVRNRAGQQVAYQVTYDGKLLIDAAVKPCGRTSFTIAPGRPEVFRSWVEGKKYPLRKDDIGWENDRGAYRVYGPALQQTGEKSYGIDVWTKNSKELDMSNRYYTDYEGNVTGWANARNGKKDREIDLHTSFHLDHGNGLDCYAVGPTLGCGAPALMVDGQLVMPYCYKSYKILDNGPLRFTVELVYNPARIRQDENVVEHRLISLDKGSNFNKMTVWYDGLSRPCDLASGVVIHSADDQSVVVGKNFVQYADPTDRPDLHGSQLYVATLYPDGAETRKLMYDKPVDGVSGHAIGVKRNLANGERYTYFFGSAWSEYDVRTQAEWQQRVDWFLQSRYRPLVVTMKKASR